MRKVAAVLSVALGLLYGLPVAGAQQPQFQPGAPGAGDPYFPLDGNGGYDVQHYLLDVSYDPPTDVLTGEATIRARATQNLSSFNLDLDGLTVRTITVNGRPATWRRARGELTVTPAAGLRDGRLFTTVIDYDGVPEPIVEEIGISGFIHTDDGALVVGEPHVASTWFPANDHPSDKASFAFRITVPRGLEAVANGILQGRGTSGGSTTWRWRAREPMATYLATATVGEFDLDSYREGGIRFIDALDPDLFDPVAAPPTGQQFMISQVSEPSFKRLARTIRVPAEGAELSFWITRDTEPEWDFVFVEAHTVGRPGDWTTLRDLNGHTSKDTGSVCPYWLDLHPFLRHYQSAEGGSACSPRGTTGKWWAASGTSDGAERWRVDLSKFAGTEARVAITYASDDVVQFDGVFIDDIAVSSGPGTTSFEDDGNTRDGWEVPGAPKGSKPNPNDWIVGTVADTPASYGENARASFRRQGEIIDFLSGAFGPYPFSASGGIVDDFEGLGFALENQTRPIYSRDFFDDPGDFVVVHELAHQWYGDSLAVAAWRHIWLNEGFATYAEWLWSEREELGTAQEIFEAWYGAIPANNPFWNLRIGDPGPDRLFDGAVYIRGAMTLHRLRHLVGDRDFFRILRRWASSRAGGNVRTSEFIALAEQISGRNLDAFFERWLFTPKKPRVPGSASSRIGTRAALRTSPAAARGLAARFVRR